MPAKPDQGAGRDSREGSCSRDIGATEAEQTPQALGGGPGRDQAGGQFRGAPDQEYEYRANHGGGTRRSRLDSGRAGRPDPLLLWDGAGKPPSPGRAESEAGRERKKSYAEA